MITEEVRDENEKSDKSGVFCPVRNGCFCHFVQPEADGKTICSEALYVPTRTHLDLTGDNQLISAELSGFGANAVDNISVDFDVIDPEKCYVFTTSKYRYGSLKHESQTPNVLTERRDGDKWVTLPEYCDYARYPFLFGSDRPWILSSKGVTFNIPFPVSQPGDYRVTVRFRENTAVRKTSDNVTTGDDLYSVAFELSVPAPSDAPMEVCFVNIGETKYDDIRKLSFKVRTDGELLPPFLDMDSLQLLRQSGNRFVAAGDIDDGGVEIVYRPSTSPRFYRELLDWSGSGSYCAYPDVALYGVNTEDTYQFRATFTENEDGSGERYTLTLNLRFEE